MAKNTLISINRKVKRPLSEPALEFAVPEEYAGKRLDQALALMIPAESRSRLQQWIKTGCVRLDGDYITRPREKLSGGEVLYVEPPDRQDSSVQAEDLPLSVVYEDEDLLVINKPAGLVVHPGAGNASGTLMNALLHHVPGSRSLPRAGIVHRLDKDTSGVLVVAKTEEARLDLIEQLQDRTMSRTYLSLVYGHLVAGGTVDEPIGRHPVDRTRMAVVGRGRPAVTHYSVIRKFKDYTLLSVKLETGRTHQIRVHMAYIQHPVVGDPVYGGRPRLPKACSPALKDILQGFRRQALHAQRLGLVHPRTAEPMSWEVPLPQDMQALIDALEANEGELYGS